jgi:hypothetical protein
MIRDLLIVELGKKFGAGTFQTGKAPAVVFLAKHPDVGDVRIWDDGDEVTVAIGDITHGHFGLYDKSLTQEQIDREVTDQVIDFLDALFSDRVLLYRSESGQSGGWARLDLQNGEPEDDVWPAWTQGATFFLWSGPQ